MRNAAVWLGTLSYFGQVGPVAAPVYTLAMVLFLAGLSVAWLPYGATRMRFATNG